MFRTDDYTYGAKELDRAVVNPDQIRTVVRTFRDKLPGIFPGRDEVPKTLIFAKTDSHADDIIQTVREEFGQGNDFWQEGDLPDRRRPQIGPCPVPQRLPSAHRRDRRHDLHGHRREAARMPHLHARRAEPHLLRADEGAAAPVPSNTTTSER